jgi:PEP-CTERM motif
MNPFKIALAATTALVASNSLSFANVIAQTESFSALTDWGTTPNTSNFTPTKTVGFTGFNTALGTLNSITITITDSINGSVNLQNKGATASNVTASLLNNMKVNIPTFSQKLITLQTNTFSDPSLAPGATSGSHPVTATTTRQQIVTSNLSTFETNWAVTAGDLGAVVIGSGNGNGAAVFTDTGEITIVAAFNFTAAAPPPPPPPVGTPEPATLTVVGAGLMGLGVVRRRRKAK